MRRVPAQLLVGKEDNASPVELSTKADGVPMPVNRKGYIPELDGLRAVACLMVILFHSAPDGLFSGGFVGVDIFFVLSGFLITSLLMDELEAHGRIHVLRFYLRRSLRLIPALLLFLGAYLAIAPLIWPNHPHFIDALSAATYASDYTYPLYGSPFYIRHTWSLSVEEQFYLIWPLLVPFILRARRPIIVLALIWAVLSLWRFSFWSHGWIDYYYRFDTHSTGLFTGALLAVIQRKRPLQFAPSSGTLAALGVVLLVFTSHITRSAIAITATEALSALIIVCSTSNERSRISSILRFPLLVKVGKISYALYLWHFPISLFLRKDHGLIFTSILTIFLSLAAALLSYYTVEQWGRRLRRQFSPQFKPASMSAVA